MKFLLIYSMLFAQLIFNAEAVELRQKNKFLYLNVYYQEAGQSDTLIVSVDNILFTMSYISEHTYSTVMDKSRCFRFKIPVTEDYGLFSISKPRNNKAWESNGKTVRMLELQLWESGDSVDVHISFKETRGGLNSSYEFSGRGSEKYNLVNKIKHLKVNPDHLRKPPMNWDGNILNYDEFDSIAHTTEKLSLLNRYKNKVSDRVYDVIKANLIYEDRNGTFSIVRSFVNSGKMEHLDQRSKNKIIDRFNASFDFPANYGINPAALAMSTNFITFLLSKLKTACYLTNGNLSMDCIYDAIKVYHVSFEVKEALITFALWSKIRNSSNQEKIYDDAAKFVKNPAFLKVITDLKRRLPGTTFEAFTLKDTNHTDRSLSEFKNKVVLIDFWFTGCGGCASFYTNTLSKVEHYFKDNPDVIILSISMDLDQKKWFRGISEGRYTSAAAINLYTNGLGFKHPVVLNNNIISAPYVVLLDRKGRIKHSNTTTLYEEQSLIEAIKGLL